MVITTFRVLIKAEGPLSTRVDLELTRGVVMYR